MKFFRRKKKKHPKILTKSRFLHGLQCPLLLWTEIHFPGKIPARSELTKTMFDAGNMVGKFAQKLFPGGISLPYLKFEDNIRSTRRALRKRKPLFEAGIMAKRLFSRVDILEPAGMFSWNIVEVKSSSSVKGINIQDVAFQLHCAKKAGIRIKKCYLIHINTSYVRHGEPDPKKLFVKVDITEAVRGCERSLTKRIKWLLDVIDSTEPPKQDIGEWCDSPYQCELTGDCWNFLPDHSIFELYSFGRKAFDLYRKGILAIKEIPKDYRLNHKQEIQRKSVVENSCYSDKEAVKQFLSKLEYPFHFMDFETVNPPIPLYDGTRPFQQIPFQFALYVIERKGAKPHSLSFLADGEKDPRREFMEELKKGLGAKGSVICYNMMFENKIVRELSHLYPGYRAWAEDIISRTVDLLAPFKNFECYHPEQAGSASLKSVLPALTGMSYKKLNIAGGGEASAEFLKILHGRASNEEKLKIRGNLIEYCGLDARGMHHILEELEKMVNL